MTGPNPALAGKVALVTGGSRGLGKGISDRLAAAGAFVVLNYASNAEAAKDAVAEIEAAGGRAAAVQADIGSHEQILRLYERTDAILTETLSSNRIDILVNNAGVAPPETVETMTEELYDRIMGVNLKAPYFLSQQVLSRMPDGGRIINISSLAARQVVAAGVLKNPVYSTSKHGLTGLTRNLAVALGPRNITVNSVEPGWVMTELLANTAEIPPALVEAAKATTALGRFGEPRDIADAVAFLASHEGRWVTGQAIAVDGGLQL
jgi:NAD(P)-dependent dehydrogenase (short-subunit alcohol dehydrogenase family)